LDNIVVRIIDAQGLYGLVDEFFFAAIFGHVMVSFLLIKFD